jgi:hypothetical protein
MDSQETETKKEAETAALPTPSENEKEYVFPELAANECGAHHVDLKTNIMWIAIKLPALDYEGAKALLDKMKFDLYTIYREISRQMRMSQNLKMPPPPGAKVGIDEMMRGLRGK